MENVDQDQRSSSVYRIRELLKKIRIRTNEGIRDSYTTNEERIKMEIGITKRKDILIN